MIELQCEFCRGTGKQALQDKDGKERWNRCPECLGQGGFHLRHAMLLSKAGYPVLQSAVAVPIPPLRCEIKEREGDPPQTVKYPGKAVAALLADAEEDDLDISTHFLVITNEGWPAWVHRDSISFTSDALP